MDKTFDYHPQSTLTPPPTMEQSLVSAIRRSTRLALENSKEDSLYSKATENWPIHSHKHKPSAKLKRKAPMGEAEARDSLIQGGSSANPIDVDALHAVLERYPVKREPQVHRKQLLSAVSKLMTSLVTKAGCHAYRASKRGTRGITDLIFGF